MFLVLLIRKPEDVSRKMCPINILANLLIIPALVLSHPATPLFLILNLITAIILIKIFINGAAPYIKEILFKTILISVTWVTWNFVLGSEGGTVSALLRFCNTVIESLFGGTELESATKKLSSTAYKPTYYIIIQMHLVHWVLLLSIALLIFMVYHLHRTTVGLTLSACFLSSQSTAVLFFLGGLAFFSRPSVFTYITSTPIIALALGLFLDSLRIKLRFQKRNLQTILSFFILVFISLSALSMPVLKYSDIPFLYMPTKEHEALKFTLINLPANHSLVSTSYNTPSGFYTVLLNAYGGQKGKIAYSDWRYLAGTQEIEGTAVLVLRSCIMRDTYFQTNQSYQNLIEILNSHLSVTHSKVYDSGESVELFVPINH
jgi:hypothetical protein